MKSSEFQKLLLEEVREVKTDVKQVRQSDIPDLNTRLARLEANFGNLKEDMTRESKRSAQIYGGVGSLISTMVAVALTMLRR